MHFGGVMKQKPDIMLTLFAVFVISLIISGFTTLTQEPALSSSEQLSKQYEVVMPAQAERPQVDI